jgi:hypothetical protein
MRFPLNANKPPLRCPVCKKPTSGADSAAAPQPESVSLGFTVLSHVHGRSAPVFLGAMLQLGWDAGIAKHPRSRANIGAAFTVAKKEGRDTEAGEMELRFCSARCLRQFLNAAVDELDRRIALNRPAAEAADKTKT